MSNDTDTPITVEEFKEAYSVSYTLRRWYMFFGAALVVGLLFLLDPDMGYVQNLPFGGTTLSWIVQVLRGLFVVSMTHITVSSITSWNPEAEFLKLIRKANDTPTGAGLAIVGLAIIFFGVLSTFSIK